MDVNQITQPTNSAPAPARVDRSVAGAISSDFTTFLKMLTTQIQNQDPLDPMKSEEFAVQLATFSGVEQQVRTNELLEAMAGDGRNALTDAGAWIGREVSAPMPVAYDGVPLDMDPPSAVAGSLHQVVLKDEAGIEVARLTSDGMGGRVVWNGNTPIGPAQPGTYTASLESFEDGALVAEQPVAVFARVVELRLGASGTRLVTASGAELDVQNVRAVREASL